MIMEEWKEYKLSELCNIFTGKKDVNKTTPDGAYPFFSCAPTPYKSSEYIYDGKAIIVAGNGSFTGRVTCYSGKFDLYQRTYACVPIVEEVNFIYLYYYMKAYFEPKYMGGTRGSSIPYIVKGDLADFKVQLPSLNKQGQISSILASLDDKIEVNRRINENLEQQAQALFKSWFVDFEPFKDQPFVESELGMIPEGWRVAKIKDIPHTLNTGKRPKGGAIASGVPSIGAEQLKGLCNYDYTKTKYISKEYSQSIPKGKVVGYEVYLNRVGGKPGDYIQNTTMFGEGYPYENCYINDHVFKLDFMQNRRYNVYIYFTFLTSRIKKYLNACGGKAAIPVINKQNIDDIYVFLPENEYIKKFGEYVLPMIKKMLVNSKESRRLAELRDTLLPRLMSGELKVNDLENNEI